jgi:hypothetical protein
MKQTIFQLSILLIVFIIPVSCSKDTGEENAKIKEGSGTVWLSGGLFFCAEQIRMNNGDTLIPANNYELLSFQSGQKVRLKYSEIDTRESGCSIGKDCEIIDIKLIE